MRTLPQEDIVALYAKYKGLSDRELLLITAERLDVLSSDFSAHKQYHARSRAMAWTAFSTGVMAFGAWIAHLVTGK